MENALHEIIRERITLSGEEVDRNNQILHNILPNFIDTMRNENPLFNAMYRRTFYGGSYYDGLKVGKPDEFDLDLLLDIPKYAQPELVESHYPGFVQLRVNNFDGWMRQPEASPYRNLEKIFDDRTFLNTDKTLKWMESVVQRSVNRFSSGGYGISFSKSGPALTLHVYDSAQVKAMDIDLVPCFVFGGDKWPRGFRANPVPSKPEFFIVPKKPKNSTPAVPHHWRLSFQEQERALISGKERLKSSIKLLKTLRDEYQDSWLASYYIKTIFLHLCEQKGEEFWKNSLDSVFKEVLKDFKAFIDAGKIPYYWKDNNNLLVQVDKGCLKNVSNRLKRILKTIDGSHPERIKKQLFKRSKKTLKGSLYYRDIYWTPPPSPKVPEPSTNFLDCLAILKSLAIGAHIGVIIFGDETSIPVIAFSAIVIFEGVILMFTTYIDYFMSPQNFVTPFMLIIFDFLFALATLEGNSITLMSIERILLGILLSLVLINTLCFFIFFNYHFFVEHCLIFVALLMKRSTAFSVFLYYILLNVKILSQTLYIMLYDVNIFFFLVMMNLFLMKNSSMGSIIACNAALLALKPVCFILSKISVEKCLATVVILSCFNCTEVEKYCVESGILNEIEECSKTIWGTLISFVKPCVSYVFNKVIK